MKKGLMMLGIATMMLASCTNEDVLNVSDSRTIGFDAFVGKTTKADITDGNIQEFYVFGGYDNNLTNVFNNVKVYLDDTWKYDNTQYWTADKTYKFQGYAPATNTAEAGENGVNFTNFVADGETDLLASEVVTRTTTSTEDGISNSGLIQLTFRHVLSKIKFKFTTNLDNVNIAISDLTVNALPNTGTYTNSGTTGTWDVSGNDNYTLSSTGTLTNSDDLVSGDAIVLPQTPSNISVTFTVTATGGLSLTKAHTVTLPGNKLEEGNVYVYTANITAQNIDPENPLKPIEFGDPTVEEWSTDQTGGDVIYPTPVP